MNINEMHEVARGAMEAAVNYIHEAMAVPDKPSVEECQAVTTAVILTASLIEAYLKGCLPEHLRHNTRAVIEHLSHAAGEALSKSKTTLDKPAEGGMIIES